MPRFGKEYIIGLWDFLPPRPGGFCHYIFPLIVLLLLPLLPANAERISHKIANFSALDKITGRIANFDIYQDEHVKYGQSIHLIMHACYTQPPTEAQSTIALVEIFDERSLAPLPSEKFVATPTPEITALDNKSAAALPEHPAIDAIGAGKRIFYGWMFAESPALNALEHPIVDIWLVACADASPILAPENRTDEMRNAAGSYRNVLALATEYKILLDNDDPHLADDSPLLPPEAFFPLPRPAAE